MIMEQLKGHDLLDAIRYAIHDIETLNTYFAYDQVRERGFISTMNTHPAMLTIQKVVFNRPATIIFWSDGTKTVVKCAPHDVYDSEKGLAIGITKKMFGNDNRFHKAFKKWVPKEKKSELKRDDFMSKHLVVGSVDPAAIEVQRVANVITTDIQPGDRISFELNGLGKFSATACNTDENGTLFIFDEIVKVMPMTEIQEGWLVKVLFPAMQEALNNRVAMVDIPTYGQIFGHDDYYEYFEPDNDTQLSGMDIRKNRIAHYQNDPEWYWLKNKRKESAAYFAHVNYIGNAHCNGASDSNGVRPVFRFK